ncbi:MAG: hypothetical protein B7Z21_00150, partial [Verrucomicrobiales bacterium 32-60-5]
SATDDAARYRIETALVRMEGDALDQFRDRLRATVLTLCETVLTPAAIEPAALAARVEAAAAMFARAADERVIRLHPNYHGYDLQAPAFRQLLPLAAKHRLLVQLVIQMENERTQNPQVRVAPVDLKPLSGILQEMKEPRIMLLNANAAMLLRHLQECPNVWIDFAMIEGVGGVENLLKTWPLERLVFGSFAPVFYWESARLKMQESALSAAQTKAVQWQSASALLA